jgi:3-hydroxyisobutyrate dehydrogenase-like beta-hydroxyacid dehydrogenase
MDAAFSEPAVGLLHPGAMGAAVGAALVDRGVRVCWASSGRSAESRRRAETARLEDAGTLDQLSRDAAILLSICPPHAALDVAAATAGCGFSGLYVDANAIAPSTALTVQETMARSGARFVDGDLIGGPPRPGGGTRLYLSGTDAEIVAELFADSARIEAVVLEGGPTAASGLKMCYAAWTKGSAALLLALRAVAQATGVEGPLLREWERSQPDLNVRMEAARRAAPKAWRFAGEMDEIARCFADVGVASSFHEAAADVYRALATLKDVDAGLDSIVATLLSGTPGHPAV